jgi:ankyrin repeat protein
MKAIETRSAEAVRAAVLAHPSQLNVREGQFRPLSWAAYFGSEAMVKVLLDAGADASPEDVLSNAYSYSAHGCVTLLRRAGAGGWTRLHAAASLGDAAAFTAAAAADAASLKTAAAALDDRGFSPRAIAAIFNTSGALAHALDAAACPPLTPTEARAVRDQVVIEAAKRGDAAACRGGEYGGGTEFGRTALHWAVHERGRCVEALRALLENAQPALRDARETTGEHWSALHVAAYFNEGEAARVLLAQGASLTVCDRLGRTPLATAVSYKNDRVAALIREAGGK